MEESRRDFLKKAGMGSLIGLGVFKTLDKFGVEDAFASSSTEEDTSGTRLGLVIDAKKCKAGCTECINKCHAIHNVPKFEDPKDEVKWLWKDGYHNVFPSKSGQFMSDETKEKPFLALCNHCKNPPCVRVCPTKATFKRSDGIVLMDFHRCIGCRFCMAACPYGSRSFNWNNPRQKDGNKLVGGKDIDPSFPTRERGVVEKCNLCAERLAKNLIPACVEVCPEEALIFGDLNNPNSKIRQILKSNHTIQRKPELGTGPSVFYIV